MVTDTAEGLRYALLLGQGRSGTNYLLHLLNQSPYTHCRNEADQLEQSALSRLSASRFFVEQSAKLEQLWDDAVRDAALTMGARDHRGQGRKVWLYPGMRRAGYFYLRQSYRLVHLLRRRGRPMHGRERRFPLWMAANTRLEKAFHVFKLNAACGLAAWMLEQRAAGKAIHIVRHPGGFTKSWLRRWVDEQGTGQTERESKARLRSVMAHDSALGALLGDPEPMSFIEAELWFWRYANERILSVGEGKESYLRVVYEQLAQDPTRVTRQVYDFCQLPWDGFIEARAREISRGSKRIASAWKDELDHDVVQIIEKVLDGSPLRQLWDE